MPNTFTQLYVQCVFSVKGRQSLIRNDWKEELHKYITGLVQHRGHKLIAINCMPDHTHIFIGMKPDQSLSDLVRDIKAISSKFINEQRWVYGKFSWQEGYGAFSYSHSQLDAVVRYIRDQEKHHHRRTFQEEYLELLKKFNIEFKDEYVFKSLDN